MPIVECAVTSLFVAAVLVMSSTGVMAFADRDVILSNGKLSVAISSKTFGVTSIRNMLSGEAYQVEDRGFAVELGHEDKVAAYGIATPTSARLIGIDRHDNGVTFQLHYDKNFRLKLTYHLRADNNFVEKTLHVSYSGPGNYNIHRLTMFDWDLSPRVATPFRYWGTLGGGNWPGELVQDPQQSTNAIGYFLRDKQGGSFLALTTDYFAMEHLEDRYVVSYWPGYILPAGQDFSSERGIIGVYRRKGLMWPSAYTVEEAMHLWPSPASVAQQLDLGEIDAYSTCVKSLLRPQPYVNWINGWALGLPEQVDTPEKMQKAKDAVDVAAPLAGPFDVVTLFSLWGGLAPELPVTGTKTPWIIPDSFIHLFDYIKLKGFMPFGACHPGNNIPFPQTPYIADKPDWGLRKADGSRQDELAIGRQYADFMLDRASSLIRQVDMKCWIYDFLSLTPDYDTEHGYLPGAASLYPQWKNMLNVNLGLRRQFPELAIWGCIGWIGRGPWFHETLAGANNCEDMNVEANLNFHTYSADQMVANNIRLANWYNHCSRMMPFYFSNATLFHYGFNVPIWDRMGFEYSILSNIATSRTAGQLAILPNEKKGEPFLEEEIDFLRKWLAWNREHESYYEFETPLFGEPRRDGVDGYAYCKDDHGFLFVCNSSNEQRTVSIPLGKGIRLHDTNDYLVKEIYPREYYHLGTKRGLFAGGSLLVTGVTPESIRVFEIQRYQGENNVLFGIPGQVDVQNGALEVSGVNGETGSESLIAIRGGSSKNSQIRINGRLVPCSIVDGLAVAKVRFAGEKVPVALEDWQVRRRGEKVSGIAAEFYVPQAAEQALKQQQWSLTPAVDNEQTRERVAWLDPSRFIVTLPLREEDVYNNTGEAKASADGYTPSGASGAPAAIMDNKPWYAWQAADTSPGHWVQLEWSEPIHAGKIVIANGGNNGAAKDMRVLYDSAGQWVELLNLKDCQPSEELVRPFEPVDASKFRVVVDAPYYADKPAALTEVRVMKAVAITARVNDQEVPVLRNMMGPRFSGFFLDLTSIVRYGGKNTLELTSEDLRESYWLTAPRIQNLRAAYTSEYEPVAAPESLIPVDAVGTEEALPSAPWIGATGHQLECRLLLRFASEHFKDWTGKISIDQSGSVLVFPTRIRPYWGDKVHPTTGSWELTTEGTRKAIELSIKGTTDSVVQIDCGGSVFTKTLGEVLRPIREQDDPWQNRVAQIEQEEGSRMTMDVLGRPGLSNTVQTHGYYSGK